MNDTYDIIPLEPDHACVLPKTTYIQVVLPLVLSDLLQDGQILLLNAVILRFLPIHRLLLFHFIVVQILNVLLVEI